MGNAVADRQQARRQYMYRNKAVLEAIQRLLATQHMTIEQWEDSLDWPRDTILQSLQPLDKPSINRNIRLSAEKLGIDLSEFLDLVRTIDEEMG